MIALFGGTFDPIHLGHLFLAQTLLQKYDFEKVLFIPAGQNPLKTNSPLASDQYRLQMIQAALKEKKESRFEVTDIELNRGGKSYTVETIEELKKKYPNKEFALILGDEVFKSFSDWKRPLVLLNYVNLIIISRSKTAPNIEETLQKIGATPRQLSEKKWTVNDAKTSVEYFSFDPLPFSSTSVRENLRGLWGKSDNVEKSIVMPQGIQRSVWQVIKVNKLYSVTS